MKCITQRLRAIDDNEKAARRQSILDAAKVLFLEDTSGLPSVISIARKAGLAKGTVYLYFRTKEEIFLAILTEDYETLMVEVIALLDNPSSPDELVNNLISTLIGFLDANPRFMPLASMASSVLEKNVNIEIVGQFKLMLADRINKVDEHFLLAFPHFKKGQCGSLLLHTNALSLGLWQMQSWPDKLKPLLNEFPFNTVVPDFKKDLTLSLKNLWKGALSS